MRCAVVLCVLVVVLAADARAAAPWGPAEDVTTTRRGELRLPSVDVDDRGLVVAVWSRSTEHGWEARGARRTRDRGFGASFALRRQHHSVDGAVVRFDGDRTAVVAYRRFVEGEHGIETQAVLPSGRRTRPVVLTGGPTAQNPRFVDAPFDRPLLLWRRAGEDPAAGAHVALSRADPDGRLGRPVRYTLEDALSDVAVGAEPDGDLLLAFVRRSPDAPTPYPRVVVAHGEPDGGRLGLESLTEGTSGYPREPAVAVTPGRRAVVAWTEPAPDGGERILVAERGDDGAFGAPRGLASEPGGVADLRLVADGEDGVTALWLAPDDAPSWGLAPGPLRIARVLPGGGEGRPRTLSAPGHDAESFAVDTDGRGGVTAAWIVDGRREPGGPAYAAAVTARGRIGKVQRLTRRGRRALTIDVAVGPEGDAAAIWVTPDGRAVRAARRP